MRIFDWRHMEWHDDGPLVTMLVGAVVLAMLTVWAVKAGKSIDCELVQRDYRALQMCRATPGCADSYGYYERLLTLEPYVEECNNRERQ